MATSDAVTTIVKTFEILSPNDKKKTKATVKELLSENVLSMNSKGVQLDKDGTLTLLQVGTLDGRVYLFDVMLNKRQQDKSFFKDTGLDEVLTSDEIVKVIHSCSDDSAALFHQFGIHLENVFDTQVAHLLIEEHKGRQLPSKLKLAELCEQYPESAEVYVAKESLKMQWNKLDTDFWTIRPLTEEMIKCASCDVTALIPEIYEAQKIYITEKELHSIYQERVREEIDLEIDSTQKDRRIKRNQDTMAAVLTSMDKTYPNSITYKGITDPDGRKALLDFKMSEINRFSHKIKRLKQECWIQFMDDLKQDLLNPDNFDTSGPLWLTLDDIERHGSWKQRAKTLKDQLLINEMMLKDINKKYEPGVSMDMFSPLERAVLTSVHAQDGQDEEYTNLRWKIEEKAVDEETRDNKYDEYHEVYMSIRKLTFFTKCEKVPPALKTKSIALKEIAEKRVIQSISLKYTEDTKIDDLTCNERAVLGSLQIPRNPYHPVVVALCWKQKHSDLCATLTNVRKGKFQVSDGFRRYLEFLGRNRKVPENVKDVANNILSAKKTEKFERGEIIYRRS